MMWNNAGSFLAPRQETTVYVVASASTSDHPSSEAEDVEFTVTTPVTTPCVLSIARRDHFFGSTLAAQPSFFVERVVQAHDVQAPRFVHEVNKMQALLYALLTWYIRLVHNFIVTTVLEIVREESPRFFGKGHVATFLLCSDGNAGMPKCSVARSSPDGRFTTFAAMAQRPTCLGP